MIQPHFMSFCQEQNKNWVFFTERSASREFSKLSSRDASSLGPSFDVSIKPLAEDYGPSTRSSRNENDTKFGIFYSS